MSVDQISGAQVPQTQVNKIPFKGGEEQQYQPEVVVDEQKSNAAKYMIGLTALGTAIAVGVLGYKGKLGPKLEKLLGGDGTKAAKNAADKAAKAGTNAADDAAKATQKGAAKATDAINPAKDKIVAQLEKKPPIFPEGKTEVVKKLSKGGSVKHVQAKGGSVVSAYTDEAGAATRTVNWTKDGKVASIEKFEAGGKSAIQKFNKEGVLSEVVQKDGDTIISTTKKHYNKAGELSSVVTKDADGKVISKIGRTYNADGKEVTRIITKGTDVTKFKLNYTEKGKFNGATVTDKVGKETKLGTKAFETAYPDFFKK